MFALIGLALLSPAPSRAVPVGSGTEGAPGVPAGTASKLLRYPDVHDDVIAFVYSGDIWTVPAAGGLARRITSHPGMESFPKFSPDGRRIAFTGQYGGDEQVYVMPSIGGVPKQLTAYPAWGPLPARWGSDNQVVGWTPDGESVLFRSWRQEKAVVDSRLYTVAVDGGLPSVLPMPRAGSGTFSPDGQKVLYSPQARDFRTWKHYRGGWAQELWIYDLDGSARNVTQHDAVDRDPIWSARGIFFVSNRNGALNLYRMSPDDYRIEQLTHHEGDVRWASGDANGNVVYELQGSLRLHSADGADAEVTVYAPDDGVHTRPRVIDVGEQIEDFDLGPNGRRAAITARGDVFSVPVGEGVIRNLTHSDTHERLAAWSPDGTVVAYVSDASGEEEVWLASDQPGAEPRQLTHGHQFRLYHIEWSPAGDRIAAGDHRGNIYVIDVRSGELEKCGETGAWYRQDFAWSPDGRYLAWSALEPTFLSSIFVWSERTGTVRLTSPLSNEFSPAWHASGDYLFFLGDRGFGPQIGANEWNYVVNRETSLLGIALRPGLPDPFAPVQPQQDEPAAADRESPGDEPVEVNIELEGIELRIFRAPLPSDNFGLLVTSGDDLLLVRTGALYLGREPAVEPELVAYSITDREQRTIAGNILGETASRRIVGATGQVQVAADAPKVLVRNSETGFEVYDTGSDDSPGPKSVDLDNLRKRIDPRREWRTAFDEVWRRFRDFFYVRNMHGYDWEAIGARYHELLPHVSHRSDLSYLIGEMIAELNVGHAYVFGGDAWDLPRPPAVLIGASFELDTQAGRYRIARILPGDNSDPVYHSPLTQVGVDVDAGDYLLAINGVDLTSDGNPYSLLREQAGPLVELVVSPTPDYTDSRRVLVKPLDSEQPLVYYAWVEGNRRTVDELSGGRIGYLHLPNMGAGGIREFIRSYYGQIRKDGLIVDVRGNTGGNVSQMILERLFRKPYSLGYVHGEKYTRVYPWGIGGNRVFTGEIAVIANETTLSDGEAFTWTFQQAGRGPVIGTRTWGGVIGIDDTGVTVDGGGVRVPQFALANTAGEWVVEGTGVVPDIPVANLPTDALAGRDRQLERAVAELLRMLGGRHPGQLAAPEPGPDRAGH